MAEANAPSHKRSKKSSIISSPNTPSPAENISLDFNTTVENFIVIWLDAHINEQYEEYRSTVTLLQQLVHLILPFKNSDQCVDFITEIKNEKLFLIISGSLGQIVAPLIQNLNQIDSIYIYCDSRSKHEKWAKQEKKIKGVFKKIESIYDVLRRDVRQCEDDLITFNILSSTYDPNENSNESDQLFIYTQLLKDSLIEMDYKTNEQKDFADFCLLKYEQNQYQLDRIREFKNDYKQSSSIWWYTRECFVYSMLNKAFRIQDMDMISKMGFFIRDMHQEIQNLNSKSTKKDRFTVYRGQGILEEEFQKILDNPNGFLSFNNFLITTLDKQVSLIYARAASDNHGLIGVLFQMEIDPSTVPFISLNKVSYYPESEKEILFSTRTIFRINNIQSSDDGLWEIKLILINDEIGQLQHFKELMRQEIGIEHGPQQLEKLMNKFKKFDKSKPVNEIQDSGTSIEEPDDAIISYEQPEPVNNPTAPEDTVKDDSPMAISPVNEQPANPLMIESSISS